MKSIYKLLIITLLINSCAEPVSKNYVEINGTITNFNGSSQITVYNRSGFNRQISIKQDGTFSDTLNVTEGRFIFNDGISAAYIYLKNNNVTQINFDADNFIESLNFTGDDADKSNVYIKQIQLQGEFLTDELFDKTEQGFDDTYVAYRNAYNDLKSTVSDPPVDFFLDSDKEFEAVYKNYKNFHSRKLALLNAFPKGMTSPTFVNYENYNGGSNSLSDFKGKYVYVDIWATWCGPCLREVPALEKLEKEFHGKNIEFVSISVDDASRSGSPEKAYNSWNNMVSNKNLSGVQLFSDKAFQSDFIRAYQIDAIPRFLLIDPEGNIVSADAPRPSSPELVKLFTSLGI